jgi:type VI secretion system secreted protein VgrG
MFASASFLQTDRLFHLETPLGEDVLLLKRISGTEYISDLFHYELDMVSESYDIDFNLMIGKPVTVGIRQSDGTSFHYLNGIVRKFSLYSDEGRLACYKAEVVPWLWLLTQTSDCRMNQNMQALDAIKQLFQRYGFQSGQDWEDQTTLKRTPWVYCTQYRESACNFVRRLMEIEGIFFFFRHEEDRHVLVMADTPSANQPCPFQSRMKYEHSFGPGYKSDVDSVLGWKFHNEFKPGKYKQRSYNFKHPDRTLQAEAPSRVQQGGNDKFEIYDFPGGYEVQADGDDWTKLRMEEEEACQAIVTGRSNCRSMYAGYRFDLYNHDRRDQNDTWLLTSVSHFGEESTFVGGTDKGGGTYYNTFTAIPYTTPYRPQRKYRNSQSSGGASPAAGGIASTIAAAMGPSFGQSASEGSSAGAMAGGMSGGASGSSAGASGGSASAMGSGGSPSSTEQAALRGVTTATVVGGSGDEIYTDAYLRVQVRFHWDLLDGQSCWARVMQPLAGANWGHVWIPRIGQEVICAFNEGDPDYPIIIGTVYNGNNMPPYKLPDKKNHTGIRTHSTMGGGADNYNEIHFDDTKGTELFSVQAEHNKAKLVKNDELEEIRHDRFLRVLNDQVEDVHGDKKQHVKGDHNEGVDGQISIKVQGDYQLIIGGDYKQQVQGDWIRVVQGDLSSSVTGDENRTVTGGVNLSVTGDLNITAANIFISAETEMCLSCGGSSIDMTPMSLSVTGTAVLINSGGMSTPAQPAQPDSPDFPDPDLGTVPQLSDMGDFGGPGESNPDTAAADGSADSGSDTGGADSGAGSGGAGGDGGSGSDSFLGSGDDAAGSPDLDGI